MTQIEIKPIYETKSDWDDLEALLMEMFRKEIYLPALKQLGLSSNVLKNSRNDLVDAILSGRVEFYRGSFKGRFNATISKELKRLGAQWDRKQGSWKIPQSSLPVEIKNAISQSESKFKQALSRIDRLLADFLPEKFTDKIKMEKIFDRTLYRVNEEFKQSVKQITIPPQLSKDQRTEIAKDWTNNMDLFVRDFTQKETKELRTQIQKSVYTGNRYETAAKLIEKSYGVSQNKAKFLARQETSLMMAKFKEVRYKQAGSKSYKWRCVHNPKQKSPNAKYIPGEVRYYHGVLDGKEFSWDDPPIVNSKGDRKHPGQDYNCRCVAVAIIKF